MPTTALVFGSDNPRDSRDTRPRRENWWEWTASTPAQAERCERAALEPLLAYPFRKAMIRVHDTHINTLQMGKGPPLVVFHGLAAGLGLWTHNLPAFAQRFTVYAIDLPGFGRSGRPPFTGSTAVDGELYFLRYLEGWREQMGLEEFSLLGHSFGGYLGVCYALRYPGRVQRLVLADPWGLGRPTRRAVLEEEEEEAEAEARDTEDARRRRNVSGGNKQPEVQPLPVGERILGALLSAFNPLAVIRAAGPWGPDLCAHFRSDLVEKFRSLHSDPQVVLDYVYHINSADPSGEEAFRPLCVGVSAAARPLLRRILKIVPQISIHFVYGENTWVEKDSGLWVHRRIPERSTFAVVAKASHHVYLDQPKDFNRKVLTALTAPIDPLTFPFSVFEDVNDDEDEEDEGDEEARKGASAARTRVYRGRGGGGESDDTSETNTTDGDTATDEAIPVKFGRGHSIPPVSTPFTTGRGLPHSSRTSSSSTSSSGGGGFTPQPHHHSSKQQQQHPHRALPQSALRSHTAANTATSLGHGSSRGLRVAWAEDYGQRYQPHFSPTASTFRVQQPSQAPPSSARSRQTQP